MIRFLNNLLFYNNFRIKIKILNVINKIKTKYTFNTPYYFMFNRHINFYYSIRNVILFLIIIYQELINLFSLQIYYLNILPVLLSFLKDQYSFQSLFLLNHRFTYYYYFKVRLKNFLKVIYNNLSFCWLLYRHKNLLNYVILTLLLPIINFLNIKLVFLLFRLSLFHEKFLT